jgi:hypothetical protein
MQQTIVFFFVFCRVVRYLGFEMSAIVGVVCHPSPIRLTRLWDFVGRVDCHGCPHNLDVLR